MDDFERDISGYEGKIVRDILISIFPVYGYPQKISSKYNTQNISLLK